MQKHFVRDILIICNYKIAITNILPIFIKFVTKPVEPLFNISFTPTNYIRQHYPCHFTILNKNMHFNFFSIESAGQVLNIPKCFDFKTFGFEILNHFRFGSVNRKS